MTRPKPTKPHHAAGRDDCWSDGATDALIDAWAGRWVQLNRGNLRQKDWKEVTVAVNAHQNGVKPPKTDIQCKNRIDTLKKKYKVEKSKPLQSKWVFYHRLDSLVGASAVADKKSTIVTLKVKSFNPKPRPAPISGLAPGVYSGGTSRLDSGVASTESSLGDDDHDDLGFDGRLVRKQRFETVGFSDGGAFRELARAILKFGEIYERIESSKQQQMMELEKQRIEFTKDLELERVNMFVDTQLEVERMKRPKYGTTSGKKT